MGMPRRPDGLGDVLENNFNLGDHIQVYSSGFATATNPLTGMYISSDNQYLIWSTASDGTAAGGVVSVFTDLTGASVTKL